jgi:sulfur carrier protein
MKIELNNEPTELISDRLFDLLANTNLLEKGGIAVAINGDIIPKKEWENTSLKELDKVLIITAAQGG